MCCYAWLVAEPCESRTMSTKLNPIALAAILGASVGVADAQASDPPREREEVRTDRRASDGPSQQAKVTQSRQAKVTQSRQAKVTERPSRQIKIDGVDDEAADRPATNAESARPSRQLKVESPSRQIKIGDGPSRQIKIDGVDGEAHGRPDPRADRRQRRPQ